MTLSALSDRKLKPQSLTAKDVTAITCFFLSGFTGLVYEIAWIRKASLVFGATTFAVSTVIGVFFAGLALGSYIFGRYSQKTAKPLKTYALLEICLGILAILNPAMFVWADNLYGLFYPALMNNFAALSLGRFLLVAALILPPTILMGGTLPLFCRQYVTRQKSISLSIALLYGINTLGAAIGAALCGLYLIPAIGVNTTIRLAAVLNILIGLLVWRLHIKSKTLSQIDAESEPIPDKNSAEPTSQHPPAYGPDRRILLISILFFTTGFIALGNEILWVRFLSLIIHNTVYTYTLTLTVILTGIVLGSIIASTFTDRTIRRALVFGSIHILAGISVLTLLMLPAHWWKNVIDTEDFSTCLSIFTLLLLFPAVLSGISFPLAIRMVVDRPSLAGFGVGKMTAINTFGAITGSLAVGFLLLPKLGLHKTLLLTTAASLLVGFAAWFLLEKTRRVFVKIAVFGLSVLIWLSIPLITGTKLPQDFLTAKARLVDFREGLNSNLAVVRKDYKLMLEIDRLWQGENSKNHQIMAAHVPMLFHQNPKDILVIGLGVGQTANRFLLYDIDRLDCVDIEEKLFDLLRKYYDTGWLADKRLKLIVEDGRNYINHTDRKYDVISIEVGQIFRPYLASFYTVDFYQRTKERLNKNGIVCQFVPIRSFGPDVFRCVIRSFLQVFPQTVLWYNRSEFMLIGSKTENLAENLQLSPERLDILSSDDAVNKDLRYAHWGGPKHWLNQKHFFLASFLCAPDSLAKMTDGADIYYDDLPTLEYTTAKNQIKSERAVVEFIMPFLSPLNTVLQEKTNDSFIAKTLAIRKQNLNDIIADSLHPGGITASTTPEQRKDIISQLKKNIFYNPDNVKNKVNLGYALLHQSRFDEAIMYYNDALKIRPDFAEAHDNLGHALLKQGKIDRAIMHFTKTVQIEPDFADAHYNIGYALVLQNKLNEAIPHFTEVLRINPDSTNAHFNLAVILAQLGQFNEALDHYKKALYTKPKSKEQKSYNADIHNNLGTAFARQNKLNEAVKHFTKALKLKPDFHDAHYNLARALALNGKFKKAVAQYQELLKIQPQNAAAHNDLGILLARQGKFDEAINHFNRAIQIKPDFPDARRNLQNAILSRKNKNQ